MRIPTVDSVIDGEPASDDSSSFTAEQWINVDVHLSYGIISAVCVMVKNSYLQRLILQILIIHLRGKGKINIGNRLYKNPT